jgi:hypothetical protein
MHVAQNRGIELVVHLSSQGQRPGMRSAWPRFGSRYIQHTEHHASLTASFSISFLIRVMVPEPP